MEKEVQFSSTPKKGSHGRKTWIITNNSRKRSTKKITQIKFDSNHVEVTRNKSPLIKANNNEKKKQQDHYNSKLILI